MNPGKVVSANLVGSALNQGNDGECMQGVHGKRENVKGSNPFSPADYMDERLSQILVAILFPWVVSDAVIEMRRGECREDYNAPFGDQPMVDFEPRKA
jgi:hypothetical protein